MAGNYLKGTIGDDINLNLASAAYNLSKLLQELSFYLQKLITAIVKFMTYSKKLWFFLNFSG